ncbi:MAG: hypothetical protein LEGION0398_MBIBDBAK_00115 [Legionellaceae bacterium]
MANSRQTLVEGNRKGVLEKWHKALSILPAINTKDLDYSRFGINWQSITQQESYNSNSVYNTFCQARGITTFKFQGYILPCIDNLIESVIPTLN